MRPLRPSAAALVIFASFSLRLQAHADPLAAAWDEAHSEDRKGHVPGVTAHEVPACVPVPAERARPDKEGDYFDIFRAMLLSATISDFYRVDTGPGFGGIYLAVRKGYLTSAELQRFVEDLILAVHKIPEITGRPPLVTKRFTVYVFPDSEEAPMTGADIPGAQHGERGIMFDFVKERKAPIFHEMTHFLAGYGESQSLAEGVAQYVQAQIRPAERYHDDDEPAVVDPHLAAKNALIHYPAAVNFAGDIGAPGRPQGMSKKYRKDFYLASWSFVDFLIRRYGGMAPLWKVIDANGEPDAYQAVYKQSYASLISEWEAGLPR